MGKERSGPGNAKYLLCPNIRHYGHTNTRIGQNRMGKDRRGEKGTGKAVRIMMIQTEVTRATGDAIEELARAAGLSRSKFIAEVLEEYIKGMCTHESIMGSEYCLKCSTPL